MSNSWAFSQLNQLTPSPGVSPQNGPDTLAVRNDLSLSFPCDGNALQAQLEAWTSVAFDFDSATDDSSPSSGGLYTDSSKMLDEDLAARDRYSARSLNASNISSSGADYSFGSNGAPALGDDLDALLSTSLAPTVAALDPYASLVDPALHLPTGGNAIASTSTSTSAANVFASSALMSSNTTTGAAVAPIAVESSSSKASKKAATKSTTTATTPRTKTAASETSPATPAGIAMTESEPSTPKLVLIDGDDEANKLAIEEDKRKRNTAASARFRIKKKQREQALESTAKELRDRVAALEAEVAGLRTENGWLRGLIVDKPSMDVLDNADTKLLLSGSRKRGREEDENTVADAEIEV